MSTSVSYDPFRTALELREQLASGKRRMAFFLGAGTSMAVGVPGITELTSKVEQELPKEKRAEFEKIKKTVKGNQNVENVLNRVRLYRELLDTGTPRSVEDLNADTAKELDVAICQAISNIVRIEPPKGIKPHVTLAQWLHTLHMTRECPVELFTTNYDLLLERAMEEVGLPFFDGFVGSVAPFFVPESVESDIGQPVAPPKCWTRLWKMHGSVGWHLRGGASSAKSRIARLTDYLPDSGHELLIFPSREKYAASRKLPFIAFQDRLRKFLSTGESVLFVLGYSFSDEHLNDIIFQGLRSNSRLAVAVFAYGNEAKERESTKLVLPEDWIAYGQANRNLSLYGPNKAVIGGIAGDWSEPSRKKREDEVWPFWTVEQKRFTLGDFNAFAEYLESYIGFRVVLPQPQSSVSPTESQSQDAKP